MSEVLPLQEALIAVAHALASMNVHATVVVRAPWEEWLTVVRCFVPVHGNSAGAIIHLETGTSVNVRLECGRHGEE